MSVNKLEFNPENAARTQFIQDKIARAVLPFRENTEAALVVIALVRCARILLDLYPAKARGELLEVITLYLTGETPMVIDTPDLDTLTKFRKH